MTKRLVVIAVCGLALCFGASTLTNRKAQVDVNRTAHPFSAKGSDNATHSLESLTKDRALLLYFIKDGCPVNARMLPHFKQIHAAYKSGTKVNIIGVYNMGQAQYANFKRTNGIEFTCLFDPSKQIIGPYGAQSSPWAVLVEKGRITKVWAGYGKSNLKSMNDTLAKLNGMPVKQLAFSNAPVDVEAG